jgi:hypothetical protein
MKLLAAIVCFLFAIGTVSYEAYLYIHFYNQCEGRLKRAADANTVDLARQELGAAIAYLEENGLTTGYTSILYRTADEDVGFWFRNLKASLEELNRMPADASQMDKTNTLMKLRETLLDHREGKEAVTCPEGMSRFPGNSSWAMTNFLSAVILCAGAVLCFIWYDDR